jgi:DNA repair protein RadC
MQKLKELPAIDRPREKLLSKGVAALSDIELLAVLLGKGKRGKDVLEIAKEIKNRFEDNLYITIKFQLYIFN